MGHQQYFRSGNSTSAFTKSACWRDWLRVTAAWALDLSAGALIYFFAACDLNEIPRRSAAFLMDLGDRPKILTTCSNGVEARASSISRRSSLRDQRDLRTITNLVFRKVAKRSMFAWRLCLGVDRTMANNPVRSRTFWGNCPVPQPIVEPLNFATNAER